MAKKKRFDKRENYRNKTGYNKMIELDRNALRAAIPNQELIPTYEKLRTTGRLVKFKELLYACNRNGMSLSDTATFIRNYFEGYLTANEMNEKALDEMIKTYFDLNEIWKASKMLDEARVYDHALRIATSTDKMADIKIFKEIYDMQSPGYTQSHNGPKPLNINILKRMKK